MRKGNPDDILGSARRIYEAAGFVLEREERHRSFGPDLAGQSWSLDLKSQTNRVSRRCGADSNAARRESGIVDLVLRRDVCDYRACVIPADSTRIPEASTSS